MNYAAPAELRDRTRSRDAQDVRTYEVRFTDPDAFLADLMADAKRGSVEDEILRLSIVKQPASVGDVYRADPDRADKGDLEAFDKRRSSYDKRLVEASYIARGQMVKLSVTCGITIDLDAGILGKASENNRQFAADRTRECAEALNELVNKILRRVEPLNLDVRGGGLYVEAGPWHHTAESAIESFPEERCATCHAAIRFANGDWRHQSTGRTDVLTDTINRRGRPAKKLHHMAHPTEEGRQI